MLLRPSSSQSNCPSFDIIVQMVEDTREEQRRMAYMLMVDYIDPASLMGVRSRVEAASWMFRWREHLTSDSSFNEDGET
jgi:hypothetical protein